MYQGLIELPMTDIGLIDVIIDSSVVVGQMELFILGCISGEVIQGETWL